MSTFFWKSLTEEISQVFVDEPFISPIFNEPEKTEEDKFCAACKTGNLEMVISCLSNGVDPTIIKNCGVQLASRYGHISIVDLLLHEQPNRSDPSIFKNHAIQCASLYGHTEVVNLLIQDPRVNPADFFNFSLKLAIEHKHTAIISILLKDPRVKKLDDRQHKKQ